MLNNMPQLSAAAEEAQSAPALRQPAGATPS
jgi:hypothetical protein